MSLYLETISMIWDVWAYQDKLLSIRIPKNLVVSTFGIHLLSIPILKSCIGLLLCLFLKITKFVLSAFNESLFSLNQLHVSFNSILIRISNWTGFSWETRFVSSAKIMKWEKGEERGRSLMYSKIKSGPRIDPCGTPQMISFKGELVLYYDTYCFLSER